jgi:hypothetical protein
LIPLSAKKQQNVCWFRKKVITLPPKFKKNKEKMLNLNLISAIIIIRLQGAAGSDLGVYIK